MRTISISILLGSLILYWFPYAYAQEDGLLGTEKIIEFYDYHIKINQYKRTSRPTRLPHICSAIITISTRGRVIEKFEYQDIDAVGWHYGIFSLNIKNQKTILSCLNMGTTTPGP
jgi:hypothetical protein